MRSRRSPRRLAHSAARIGRIAVVMCGAAAATAWVLVRHGGRGRSDRVVRETGAVVSAALWRLGPAFIKIGQMLASRRDLFAAAFCEELESALARGRAGGAQADREIGSVAAVERRRVGRVDAAVKTLHPTAAELLRIDLGLITAMTRIAALPLRRSGPTMRRVVREMCESVRRQTDLMAEAATLRRFEDLETALPVVFPRVLDGDSGPDVLTMTWLPGQAGGRRFPDPRRTARRLVLTIYEMLFITGVVHCDLHPGNWWELPDGRLAIVDAGFTYELDEEMRTHFAEFFLGMSSGNAEICATHALAAAAGPVPPEHEKAFRRDMEVLIGSITGLTAGSFSLTGFAARLFAIQRRHGAFSRAEFVFPLMALLAIEGQVKQLDPKINFQSLAGPVVLRSIVARARAAHAR
ncbi:AarF/ABC1/UbiB kinase family protein [Microbispora sp. RL4-1S]|uniref:AarF/ABC1/UbiB kinase family protein n=1 Tax=Microbispora oryzae TaxID=2806554 RepID=A0A940WCM2_9ACTN|nr:AarF/UbiB family protein [Microbispora oryzae]MBP2702991.1 AarF/ABC1/UbiB kinase family protein [Microbispora oryzae]